MNPDVFSAFYIRYYRSFSRILFGTI